MNEETKETQESSWQEAHPWLSQMTSAEDQDDSVGEVIRYTLDKLRFALGFYSLQSPFFGLCRVFFFLAFYGMISLIVF
jgi:hypothetical protein